MWLVTQGAQPVGGGPIGLRDAALAGLARVVAHEHPELRCACVDVDLAGPVDVNALADALLQDDDEDLVALRAGARHVARFAPAAAPEAGRVAIASDATYWITGAFGGLGLLLARWLVDRGARHLVLTGRRAPSQAAEGVLAELRARGANIVVELADVSRDDEVAAVVDRIARTMPPLRGVAHAPLVLDDGLIAGQTPERVAKVFAPKVDGALLVDAHTRGATLDWFLLFSSVASVLGLPGQVGYAAANSVLDALAHARRREGLAAIAINWGPWSDIGAAAADDMRGARLATRGMEGLSPAEGLVALEALLADARPQVAVVELRRGTWRDAHGKLARLPYFAAIGRDAGPGANPGDARRALEATPAGERRRRLEAFVRAQVAGVLRLSSGRVALDAPFAKLGFDSLTALELRNRLEAALDLTLPATLVWTHRSLVDLASYLADRLALDHAEADRAAPQAHPAATPAAPSEPIAIVGMACRFPGGANDPDAFWRLLDAGVDAVREVPRDRWDADAYYDRDVAAPGKMNSRWGGFLDRVDTFDAEFFGISPREAACLDPQQRLWLEVAWEALEDAGQSMDRVVGTRTGVFLGMSTNDYARLLEETAAADDAYAITGNSASFASGRLSYLLDLRGPSVVVDTACSSSLVALDLAVQSLRSGRCDRALAGGVNLILSPATSVLTSKLHALSPEGRCKTFDASADGFVRGEGCGAVVLKRLSDARRDGDRVLALVRATAVNQDGESAGLTAPSVRAQSALVAQALAEAGVTSDDVGYLEAHGTGTQLGDPIEVDALKAIFFARDAGRTCALGSVKTNIGHLEAAAGIAGLLKVVLALRHERIPRHLHFQRLNPHIDLEGSPFAVAVDSLPWKRGDRRRIAGVSSFGMSGTNAHVVLEEAPFEPPPASHVERSHHLLVLSSKTPDGLRAQAERYADFLRDEERLADVAHTASTGRAHYDERFAVVAATSDEARARLAAFARGEAAGARGRAGTPPKIAFVFTGQGSQYAGMGRTLYETQPIFRAALDRCAEIARPLLGLPLLSVMFAERGASPLDETEYTQPVIFALEYALAEMWRAWGVQPDGVLGHSVGEFAAACVAGALDVEHAMRLVATRGRLMQRLPRDGAMASVRWPAARVIDAVKARAKDVSLAAINGADQTVVSGRREAVQALCDELAARGAKTKPLDVSHAFHSALMDPILAELEEAAKSADLRPPRIALVSNVTGEVAGEELSQAAYWSRHARQPVRFSDGIKALAARGVDAYLEIGPQPTLLGMSAAELGDDALKLASLRKGRDEWPVVLESLGLLHVRGAAIDWSAFDAPYARRRLGVPTYAFQRRRHWVDGAGLRQGRDEATGHPLLGTGIRLAGGGWLFRTELAGAPYLAEHRVFGEPVLAAAAYLELCHAAARHRYGEGRVCGLVLESPLVLAEDGTAHVQIALSDEGDAGARVRIYSETTHGWTLHAEGSVRAEARSEAAEERREAIVSRCAREVDVEDTYATLSGAGFSYGAPFRGVRVLRAGDGESYAELALAGSEAEDAARYGLHPALLDAALQALAVLLESAGGAYMPFEIGEYRVCAPGARAAWVHARLSEGATGDVRLFDAGGALVAEVLGLRLKRGRPRSTDAESMYTLDWREQGLAGDGSNPRGTWIVMEPAAPTEHAAALRARFARAGVACRERIDGSDPIDGVVCVWPAAPGGAEEAEARAVAALKVVQELVARGAACSRLWWITEGAQSVAPGDGAAIESASLWGLGRVVMAEHPELRCTLLDVESWDASLPDLVWRELAHADDENQVAYRAGKRHVARLVRAEAAKAIELPDAPSYRLEIGSRGQLDRLRLAAAERRAPGPGEVEIAVRASGVNFRDVLNALGMYPGDAGVLGAECAGTVTAVGAGVAHLRAGDEVMALARGEFAPYVTVDARLVAPKPAAMAWEEAASTPVAFLTAWYALRDLGALTRGERVLVHAAAGGVGMAAVQIARWLGAEVFATASRPKWALVASMGVAHVADSRSTAFVEELRGKTGGGGFDVVLDALTGELVDAGLSLVKRGGRFLEMGKLDVRSPSEVAARYPGVHYRAFDLLDVPPERIAQMLAELGEGFARGDLRALPVRTYRVTEAEDAFRFMAQGRHVGKIALAPADVEAGPRLDGTVLVTGGLGALGLHVARWLARERRASHLLLVGRSAPSAQQDAAVEELRATGCEVTVARADVSRASDVDAVLASIPADRPLRGVVHAAGVLADGVLLEQDASGFARVFAPKVKGAWNLHERTLGAKLDFFVLFSSLSGLVGNAGQASYAAANAFLDALAHLRRARGLPALSLDWGTWSGAGMANALDGADQARLARAGIGALEAHDALELLGRALTRSEAQLALIRLDIAALRRSTNAHAAPLWRALAPVRSPAPRATLASRLAELPAEARRPEVEATIRREVAKVLSLPSGSSVPVERPLKELGVDSLMAVELRNALSMHAGAALPASLVFDYPTVAALSEHLLHVAAPGKKRTPAAMTKATRAPADESIAIVGMSCRFPGAADPDELWELLRSGRDAITEVPRGRWNVDAFYDPDPDAAGKIYTRAGGFLPDVDRFDAALFGIAPREALSMDPQQRLLLEVTWEALERAGISAHALAGSASGVFVGICSQEYGARLLHRRDARAIDAYAGTGNFASVAAGRLSYVLGLAGPAIAVDTACSSSLVTVHLASQSLRDGECDLALAGGVNLLLSPEQTILFSRLRALSPDGRCKAFDARANGYVRAEGCGVVVLKRLSDALRDGDRVFSVIRGSAVNQDGRSNGLTAPNGPSQQAVIRRALAQAGVDPSMVGYVEAHGTGTPLGDPIELHALGAVLGEGRPPDAPVVVGTIKTNIGHTEAAAGVAGLIKAVLALTHEEIPPNLHFATPSPHIAWDGLALTVATAPVPWKRGDRRRIAGVSSFGISGTNAHVVLEEAPIDAEPRAGEVERPAHVLPLSSKTAEGLRAQALRYAACLGIDELADVAHTAGAGRAHHDERLAVVAATSEEARARLEAFARGEPVGLRGRAERRPRVAFLFTGQGSQYTGMGRELYETQPVFRAALDRCAATVKGVLREPLLSVMFAEGGSTLDETAYAQPALFALEYALAEMWRSWGIEPEAVLGHSVGEYAAACVAGVLSVEDAMLLLATRGRLMQELPKGDGAMASVRGEPSRVFEALKHAGEVSLAAINSADQVVISGPRDAVRAFCDELQARGSTTKLLEASRAFHSSLMDPILGELERAARGIELRAPRIALVSNVSGELAGEEVTRAEYFSRHARGVVRFADGMKTLSSRAIDAYVEIGPQPTLLGMVAGELGEASRLPSLRKGRPAWSVLLESVGGLYVQGAPIDWRAFDAPYSRRRVTVPTYAFQRERYWLDTQARPRVEDVSGHPLLGSGMPLAGTGLVFEAELATYLAEHRVFGEAVLPATAYLELAHAAAVRRFGGGRVSGLVLQAPLVLAEDGNARVQVVVSDETEDRARVRVYGEANARWTLHAEGSLHPARDERAARAEREPVASRCAREVDVEDTYAALASAGLGYGEAFRGLRVLRAGDAEAYAEVSLAEPLAEDAPRYGVHPALLDAALQAVGALLENQGVHLPFEIGDYRVLSPGARAAWVHAQLSDGTTADVRLFDGEGAPIAEVSGVRLQRGRTRSLSAECIYRVAWREQAHAAESRTPRGVWVVLEPGGPTAHAAPLRARLASAGATCRDTIDGDGPIEGVVCLWGAGGDGAEDAEARCVAALRLVQRLVAGEATCARLCWVTEGAQSVVGDEGAAAAAAALWGLGRVVMAEHPELRCTLVDLNAEADAVDALWHELTHADDEAQVAWRAGKRHVARLVRAAATADRKSFDANAGVLITGGLGALGAHVARWLVEEKGVRRLVLAGRGAPSDERLAAIEELRRSGARITVARANVADRRDVDALVRSALEDGPLQGVIHLAGALADGVLAQQDEARMAEAFAAKARGAWNLHQSTRALRLDFFVLFSSAASLFGNAGQGAYAAANAFLDGLAHTRRAQGLAAQSLDWGPWSDGGLADTMSATSRARLARRGVRTLSPRDALELLDSALCGGEPQLALLSLDAASVRASDDRSLLRTLFRAARPAPIAEKLTARLSSLAPEARAARVEAIARAEVAKVLSLAPADLPLDRPLQELGLDSLMAVELRNALSVHVGERLPATLVFDHPTLGALARHLLARAGSAAPSPSPAPAARPAAPKAPADEPIAIVGVGCRFPGGVRDLETFWRMLDEGRDGITEMPRERWDVDELFDANPDAPGKMTTRSGGFLSEIDRFDASFFGIAPREAAKMDPQQRLLLEVSWEALEHAGIPHRALAGTATGVFVGLMYHEYQTLAARALADLDGYVGTGSLASVASGRISYLLGLQGPSLTVDTACSSSLVTVHLAAQSLRGGECDVALAGGVTLMLTPTPFVEFSRLRGLAADGRCKSFDASADGVAWSEGCGVLVLKRLSSALRDGDRVLALVRGSAVNQDGRSNGLTAPNGPAQEVVVRRALEQAGVAPWEVGYVEAHGTGTPLGDPIEVQALGAVLASGRDPARPVLVGSVKSNIGHTQAAAGVAGVIKAALALEQRRIPRSLHVSEPNPRVAWNELPVTIAREALAWPAGDGRRIAGVSAFGISGTNAHVVLESAPRAPEPSAEAPQLLLVSAKGEMALRALASDHARHLRDNPDLPLADACFTSSVRRSHHEHRLALVADSRDALLDRLDAFARGEARPRMAHGVASERPSTIAFVFAGQGGQWPTMGRSLLDEEPVFRDIVERCDRAMREHGDFSIRDVLCGEGPEAELGRVDVVQPALFAMQVGLAATWRSWGVEPAAVVGHSMGEIAAACVAGALSIEDGCRVVCVRSRLVSRVTGRGAMALVELPPDEARAAIAGEEHAISVAAENGPRSTILSGERAALERVFAALEARGVFCRWVNVDYASHSPQMDALTPALLATLADLHAERASIPLYSTVTGDAFDGPLAGSYWKDNLREPVRFWKAVEALARDGVTTFLEVNAHPTLLPSISDGLRAAGGAANVVASMRRDDGGRAALLASLGQLHVLGHDIDWKRLFPRGGRVVSLPSYAWQRERHWFEARPEPRRADAPSTGSGHAWLGPCYRSTTERSARVWQGELRVDAASHLREHRVAGAPVVAGAVWLEAALHAARSLGMPALEHVELMELLPLGSEETTTVQLVARASGFELVGAPRSEDGDWTLHARGRFATGGSREPSESLDEVRARCPREASGEDFYDELRARGLEYDGRYAAIERVWMGEDEAVGALAPRSGDRQLWVEEPWVLDACLQVLGAAVDHDDETYVPVRFERVELRRPLQGRGHVHAKCRRVREGALEGDVRLLDDAGEVVFEARGVHLQRVGERSIDRWLYGVAWEEQDLAREGARLEGTWIVLSDGPLGAAVIERMQAAGARCVRVAPGREPDFAAALRDAPDCAGVVHLAAAEGDPPTSLAELQRAQERGCASALALAKRILEGSSLAAPPRLWLVTRATQSVLAGDFVHPAHATVWGFARALAHEHPEARCTCVDLAERADALDLHALVAAIAEAGPESQIALRGGKRFVARLARGGVRAPRAEGEGALSPEASYLVTGGLGGLGLEVAHGLARRGARRLVLLGRSAPGARARRAIDELTRQGVRVQVLACDVAREGDVARALESIPKDAPLRGVVHAAGLLDDATVLRAEWAQVANVFAPKVHGAWNLHASTRHLPLDFFVLFSSAAAVLGSAGQAAYAAANAFLDALAHHRRAAGLPALTIDWGAWSEVGLAAARDDRGARLDRRGVRSLSPEQGMLAFDTLLGSDATQAMVVRLDARRWRESYPHVVALPFFTPLMAERGGRASPAARASMRRELEALDPLPRRLRLEEYLRSETAHVLRLPRERIHGSTPFASLGFDSLMAIELRNRLDAALELTLPASIMWSHRTVEALALHLAERMGLDVATPRAAVTPAHAPRPLETLLESISEEDAEAALLAKLEALEEDPA